jgi:hypothetical protein
MWALYSIMSDIPQCQYSMFHVYQHVRLKIGRVYNASYSPLFTSVSRRKGLEFSVARDNYILATSCLIHPTLINKPFFIQQATICNKIDTNSEPDPVP